VSDIPDLSAKRTRQENETAGRMGDMRSSFLRDDDHWHLIVISNIRGEVFANGNIEVLRKEPTSSRYRLGWDTPMHAFLAMR